MRVFKKALDLAAGAAVALAIADSVCSPAKSREIELVYHALLNEGSAPYATLFPLGVLAAGTSLTITATADVSSANQWSPGAYIYTALSETILLQQPGLPPLDYAGPTSRDYFLLSDPTWMAGGGPGPYSAGFIGRDFGTFGSLQSVFNASSAAFDAGDPSHAMFYDYLSSFYFTGSPLEIGFGPIFVLTLYKGSVSNVTASVTSIPEPSTWALMLVGFVVVHYGLSRLAFRRHVVHPTFGNLRRANPT